MQEPGERRVHQPRHFVVWVFGAFPEGAGEGKSYLQDPHCRSSELLAGGEERLAVGAMGASGGWTCCYSMAGPCSSAGLRGDIVEHFEGMHWDCWASVVLHLKDLRFVRMEADIQPFHIQALGLQQVEMQLGSDCYLHRVCPAAARCGQTASVAADTVDYVGDIDHIAAMQALGSSMRGWAADGIAEGVGPIGAVVHFGVAGGIPEESMAHQSEVQAVPGHSGALLRGLARSPAYSFVEERYKQVQQWESDS